MGTESEALRWKQWIDRWCKISAPDVTTGSTPSAPAPVAMSSSVSSARLDGAQPASRKSMLTPEQLQYQLINMIKEGDPIFCEGLCRELLNSVVYFRLAVKCLCGIDTAERARSFFCQVLFYLCKCPAPSVRKFLLSLVPALLFNHINLQSYAEGVKTASQSVDEESLNSIEIALLALYQADLNYQPEPGNVRVPTLHTPSIYHAGFKTPSSHFPFNVSPSLIHPPLHLYPTVPIVKISDYTRFVVYFRLCRSFQDFLPAVPELAVVMYGLLIVRFVSGGTVDEDLEALDALFMKQIGLLAVGANTPTLPPSNQSTTASTISISIPLSNPHPHRHLDADDWKFLKRLVMASVTRRVRCPAHNDLYLLWTDCITFVWTRYVSLGDLLRKQVLDRARSELLPQVLMALE